MLKENICQWDQKKKIGIYKVFFCFWWKKTAKPLVQSNKDIFGFTHLNGNILCSCFLFKIKCLKSNKMYSHACSIYCSVSKRVSWRKKICSPRGTFQDRVANSRHILVQNGSLPTKAGLTCRNPIGIWIFQTSLVCFVHMCAEFFYIFLVDKKYFLFYTSKIFWIICLLVWVMMKYHVKLNVVSLFLKYFLKKIVSSILPYSMWHYILIISIVLNLLFRFYS